MYIEQKIIENAIRTDSHGWLYAICNGLTLRSAYQPIFSNNNIIIGYEALLRITNSENIEIRTDHFFSGQLYDLQTQIFVERVARAIHIRNYANSPLKKYKLFLNVLPRTSEFYWNGVEGTKLLMRRIKELGLSPDQFVIELTELKADDDHKLHQAIRHLRDLGFDIAVDDYGMKASNEHRVRMLEPGVLKLDRSLLTGYMQGRADPLTKALQLGKEVNANIVIEGIETEAQLQHMRNLNIDFFQGFHLAAPKMLNDLFNTEPQQLAYA